MSLANGHHPDTVPAPPPVLEEENLMSQLDALEVLGTRVDHLQEWVGNLSDNQKSSSRKLDEVRDALLEVRRGQAELTTACQLQNALLARLLRSTNDHGERNAGPQEAPGGKTPG